MQAGILLITHGRIGHELLDTLSYMIGELPSNAMALAVDSDRNSDVLEAEAKACLARLNEGGGVLILTDLVGATPANLAANLAGEDVAVVTGVNLSMLVRVMNYAKLPLEELTHKALSGGRDGIARLSR